MREEIAAYSPFWGLVQRWYSRSCAVLLAPVWLVLAFGLAIPLFNHPAWVLVMMGFAGAAVGAILGGVDRVSGSEEYILALPPSRSLLYWVRALAGCTVPVAALIGLLIVRYNVSSHFWGLFASSGWTGTPQAPLSTIHYVAAFVVPLALYLVAYAGASLGGIATGLLFVLAMPLIAFCCTMIETFVWDKPTGLLTLSTLGGIGLLAVLLAYPFFLKRDAASRSGRSQAAVIAVLVVLAILILFVYLGVGVNRMKQVATESAHQAQERVMTVREIEMKNATGGTP